jgi:hypothetical protein
VGPITIFDKSALQALSADEAVWFDAFFSGNVTPLFYVETLADLEKEVKKGQTPEHVVGALASKTPLYAFPNVHHRTLYLADLLGAFTVPMDGRPMVSGGTPKRNPDGTVSVHFDEFPEAAALNRWQNHDFLDIERAVAHQWRAQLSQQDNDSKIAILRNIFPTGTRIAQLESLKVAVDEFCEGTDPQLLHLVLEILEVPLSERTRIVERWDKAGRPQLTTFAPYATYVFKVDAVFYLAMARGFISGERASNKADMAYLYYLPFSMAFTSGDRLHARTVPLFARDDQVYIPVSTLKEGLQELDRHFDALPDEVKDRGVMQFAGYPPSHFDNIVTQVWDGTMRPDWRKIAAEQEARRSRPRDATRDAELIAKIKAMQRAGSELRDAEMPTSMDGVDQVFIKRTTPVHRGKWRMISREVEEAAQSDDEALS